MTDKSETLPGFESSVEGGQNNRNRFSVASAMLSVSHVILAKAQTPQAKPATMCCRVESIDYKGWKAQQVSNRWVQLTFVPQNGGR